MGNGYRQGKYILSRTRKNKDKTVAGKIYASVPKPEQSQRWPIFNKRWCKQHSTGGTGIISRKDEGVAIKLVCREGADGHRKRFRQNDRRDFEECKKKRLQIHRSRKSCHSPGEVSEKPPLCFGSKRVIDRSNFVKKLTMFFVSTPISPMYDPTSLIPLAIVVSVTAFKQGYEDFLRHKADGIANQLPVNVFRDNRLLTTSSDSIRVGDIVKVYNNEEVPCDLILLSSSESDGNCQITTANLDGETSLKVHMSCELTLGYNTKESLNNLYAVIEYGPPISDLYSFHGKISVFTETGERNLSPLYSQQLLLRGSTLKNTDYIFGCAIYTGQETKMVMNVEIKKNKFSSLEKTLNHVLLVCVTLMLLFCTLLTILNLVSEKKEMKSRFWYLSGLLSISVAEVFDSIECDFDLIGATAVEDCLQDDVKDTLEALHDAGIKIWVLTGDHHETAFNICLGSGHMNEDTVLLHVLNQHTPEESYFTLTRIQARIAEENLKECALMIDGKSLAFALIDHPDLLGSVAASCASVLCSRLSPLQKAEVVKMVKSMHERPVTAAIGDGANDVSMIQEADVGIGIIGKEGRQAVQCSDFSIAQFKFLKRILLVHGQYYYVRSAILIQYFFYKNLAFTFPQFYFQFYNAFSPQPLYNAMFQMAFNVFFTSLPILVYGCTEKHLPEETLYNNPSIYRKRLKNKLLSVKEFLQWAMFALWHCTVAFFGTLLLWQGSNIYPSLGMIHPQRCYGATVYQAIIFIVILKLCLHTRYWTYWFIASVLLSIYGFIGLTLLYTSYIAKPTYSTYGIYSYVVKSPQTWLATFLFTVAALVPDIVFLTLCNYVSIREQIEGSFLQVYNQITKPCYNLWSILSRRKGDLSSSKVNITEEAFIREAQEGHRGQP